MLKSEKNIENLSTEMFQMCSTKILYMRLTNSLVASVVIDLSIVSDEKKKVKEKHRNEKECCVNLEKVFQNGGTPIYISCPAFCWTDFFVQNIDEISFFLEIWEEMIGCNIKIMIIF